MLSVFSAAAHSHRISVFKPLPKDSERNAILSTFSSFGSVEDLAKMIKDLKSSQVELLHYIFHPDVISVRKIGVSKWAKEVGWGPKLSLPDAVFELEYGLFRDEYANPLSRQKHQEFKNAMEKGYPVQIGYHGTELCNVYNILRESLKNDPHFSGRNGQVFGKGIYLSEDPCVAQNFLSFGSSWKKSKFGEKLACLLECEVVLDESQVSRGSKEGKVPDKYIIVSNDCLGTTKRR